jgi:zinc/manganese transport system substrate-binding protein
MARTSSEEKNMKKFLLLFLLAAALPVRAELRIFACEPEWAALAKELGGDRVNVYAATHALQDPHRVEARPSLIARARSARLAVCTGAELEAGWLPPVLRESGNAGVQPGRPGYFEAAQFVARLEIPAKLDRSEGDVHAAGNPHIQLDPRNLLAVAAPLAQRMGELDAANAGFYAERQRAFAERMRAAIARWEREAAPLRGLRVIAQHRSFSYLFHWLGIVEAGTLEPKPGIEPGSAHLAQLLAQAKAQQTKLIVRTPFDSPRAGEWLAERAGLRLATLPFTVGGSARAQDLFGLFDDTLAKLKE